MDPHETLNLPRDGFSVDQLRYNYKALARQLHPDKRARGMSNQQATELFQVLTAAYRELLQVAQAREADRSFDQLRAAAGRAAEEAFGGVGGGGDSEAAKRAEEARRDRARGFDTERFNSVFSEHRVADPVVDGGYGRWMEESDPASAHEEGRALRRRMQERRLAVAREPEPMAIVHSRGAVPYSELGATDGPVDYGRHDVASSRTAIQFSDYRIAHTTTKLAEDEEFDAVAVDRAGLTTVEALVKHRASLSYHMTPEEAQAHAEITRRLEDAEDRRLHALRAHDLRLKAVHDRTSRLLLGYSPAK